MKNSKNPKYYTVRTLQGKHNFISIVLLYKSNESIKMKISYVIHEGKFVGNFQIIYMYKK